MNKLTLKTVSPSGNLHFGYQFFVEHNFRTSQKFRQSEAFCCSDNGQTYDIL